ncbi:MAG: hypothetical protein GW905_03800 [Rhodobacterales bacterium]|nr:hypothetical protein [Rhodobacterales bacterium]
MNLLELPERIAPVHTPRKLPTILSADEFVQFPEAAASLKARAAPTTAYAAGLPALKAANLKVTDLDSGRMALQIRYGTPKRRGYANGTRCIDLPAIAGARAPLGPGRHAVAGMCLRGVSSRDVEAVMRAFGIESRSSSQRHPSRPEYRDQRWSGKKRSPRYGLNDHMLTAFGPKDRKPSTSSASGKPLPPDQKTFARK